MPPRVLKPQNSEIRDLHHLHQGSDDGGVPILVGARGKGDNRGALHRRAGLIQGEGTGDALVDSGGIGQGVADSGSVGGICGLDGGLVDVQAVIAGGGKGAGGAAELGLIGRDEGLNNLGGISGVVVVGPVDVV